MTPSAPASPAPSEADEPVVRRAAHLVAAPVGPARLVYDVERETAHLFNATAAAIWDLVDGHRGPADIAAVLAARFTHDRASIIDDVRVVLADLVQLGVVHDVDDAEGATATPPAADHPEEQPGPAPRPEPPDWPEPAAVVGPFDGLGFTFDIVAPPGLAERLDATLQGLSGAPGAPVDHRYVVSDRAGEGDPPQLACWFDDALLMRGPPGGVTAHLLWHINNRAVDEPYEGLLIHASAVLTESGAIALIGHMDAGKSTLAAALTRRGLVYVTDEAVAVPRRSLDVEAYPKPIGLDRGSWPLFPDLASLANADVTTRWWLDAAALPDAVTPVANRSRHPIAALVFIQHVPDEPTTVVELEPADAALLLTGNLFNLADDPESGIDHVIRLAEHLPCRRLTFSDLELAVAEVLSSA